LEWLAGPEMARDLCFPVDERRLHCGRQRRADAGIRRLRRHRTEELKIPNWAVRLVVLLLIIGFPVALILA
jgi:hypothetical protein